MTPKFDSLINEMGFFLDDEFHGAIRLACRLSRQGQPLNKIRQALRTFIDDYADADPEEAEAFVDQVMQAVHADKTCWPSME